MTCSQCGHYIPDHVMFCPTCISVRSFRELLARQRDYLPQVKAGKEHLRLGQVAGGARHVLLFGSDHRTWCGLDFENYKRLRSALDLLPPGVCSACRDELFKAIEEVRETA